MEMIVYLYLYLSIYLSIYIQFWISWCHQAWTEDRTFREESRKDSSLHAGYVKLRQSRDLV